MPNTDDTTQLRRHLATQRATLAQLLAQPGAAEAIAAARAAIAQLTARLRDLGVAVEHTTEEAEPLPVAARHHTQTISGQAQIGVAISGDVYGGIHLPPRSTPLPPIDLAQALALLATLPLNAIPDPAPLPPSSRVTLRRNPLFVGRDVNLAALAQAIIDGHVAAITTGIGGVGKTQLAAEFAHRYGRYFAGGVFWLSFADPAGIDSEIAACGGAGALELYSDADGLSQAEQVQRVVAAWAQPTPRLLIFDNCDDQVGITGEALLVDRLPTNGGCRVLVTSRRGHWSASLGLAAHPLGVLERKASSALLRSHRNDLRAADADALAAEVGDLPLALTLAGSYLATYRDESFGVPAIYLANLRKQVLDHRSMQGKGAAPSLTGHDLNVQATFALSYERLNQADPTDGLAITALARAACLAPGEPFPRDLLLATLGETTDDEEAAAQRADAIQRLVALGLLESAAGRALRIHRLIAAFAQGATADAGAQEAVEQALTDAGNRRVNDGFPALLHPLLAHLRHAMAIADKRGDARAGALANALGRSEEVLINYAAARPLFERALAIRERELGPAHPDTATSLNNLAELFHAQGGYPAARPLFERALTMREQVLGPVHPDTATSLNNLAELFYAQGDYAAARPLYERALAMREQVLGPAHPDTAAILNNLAELFRAQGDYAAARPLYERALYITEQTLGPAHPDTATSLNNLAGLFESQGDYAAAQPLCERALIICEQALGPVHPDTATSLNNLAYLHKSQGDYAAAQPLYERALAMREQALGPAHPDTATSLNNLALLFYAQGDYAAARPLFERALAMREEALGPAHPHTATSLNNLAGLLERQGDYTVARPLFERALAMREQALGPAHPDTATSLNNLAALFRAQGDYAAARPLYERALAIREQALGPAHPDIARSLNNLAELFRTQGDYAAARPLYERALAITEGSLGHDHPTTRTIRANLAALDAPPQTREQQIADLTAQADAAVAQALADPSGDRAALAAQLEAQAQWAEAGEADGSPYLALATHLRVLAARLTASHNELT